MAKWESGWAPQKLCLHRVKFGELWSTNSGVHGDGLATIYVPNARNDRTRFIRGTRIR